MTSTHVYSNGRRLAGDFRKFDDSPPCMMGIDEAGRGPVLGAMVYGACYAPIAFLKELKGMGFADSKQLTELERRTLFAKIKACSKIGWVVDSISPQELSAKMLHVPPVSLNVLSHDAAIGMVHSVIAQGVNLTELYVDTVGVAENYQRALKDIFPQLKVVVKSKADSLFPIVSAASICAKVTRDAELEDWHFSEKQDFSNRNYEDEAVGEDDLEDMDKPKDLKNKINDDAFSRQFGSGYPGDEVTKTWLENNIHPIFGFPSLVRFSWSTAQKIIDKKCVQVKWGDEGDAESGSAKSGKQARMGQYFMKASSPAIATGGSTARALQVNPRDRTKIYRRMNLNVATALPFSGKPSMGLLRSNDKISELRSRSKVFTADSQGVMSIDDDSSFGDRKRKGALSLLGVDEESYGKSKDEDEDEDNICLGAWSKIGTK